MKEEGRRKKEEGRIGLTHDIRPLAKVIFINSSDGQDAHLTRKNDSVVGWHLARLSYFCKRSIIG